MCSVVKSYIKELFLVFVVFLLLNIIQGLTLLSFLESVYTKYFTLSIAFSRKELIKNFANKKKSPTDTLPVGDYNYNI